MILNKYVPTFPIWTGGSPFERTTPVLPLLPEISRFEKILAWMSHIYKFFKSLTLFTHSIWKSWLLVTKLGACVALRTISIMSCEFKSIKALIVSAQAKKLPGSSLIINAVCNFLTVKNAVELNRLLLKFIFLCRVDIQENSREDNAKFNFL